jgi:exopolysaccharide biosynthesis WecB/TagA/CpsF family protein
LIHRSVRPSLLTTLKDKSISADCCLKEMRGAAVVFNSESLYFYYTDDDYFRYVQTASAIFVDGAFVTGAARLLGLKVPRYHGPDVLSEFRRIGILPSGLLVGGAPSNKSLVDSGDFSAWVDLPFSNDVSFLVQCLVANSEYKAGSSLIAVSLGLPKQEKFCQRLLEHVDIDTCLILPVGAAVDFMSGHRRRSSVFWRKIGLEWLPRLIREPRMLVRNIRSFLGVIYFLLYK